MKSLKQSIAVGGTIKHLDGKRSSILALNKVNLEIENGDRVALLGHNGAGKSSMLKLLSGFYEPTSGSISRNGKISALLHMTAGMDVNISGFENILLCGMLRGLSRAEVMTKIDDIAEFSGLGEYLDMPLRLYSDGMMLRLAFSICTSVRYEILLMDEWFGTGDIDFLQKSKERLKDVVAGSAILVFATHSSEVARQLCNKAVYLEHGNVLKYGEIDDVLDFQDSRRMPVE